MNRKMPVGLPRILGWLSLALGLLSLTSPAEAKHTRKEHITDQTAWTMQGDKRWRLGLWRDDFGFTDRLTVSTYHFPWLARSPNFGVKYRFYSGDDWHWAAWLNILRFRPEGLFGLPAGTLAIVSLGVTNSIEWGAGNRHQYSHSLLSTSIQGRGEIAEGTLQAGISTAQYEAAYEWRISEKTAFVLSARYLLAQTISAEVDTTVSLDDYTTLQLVGTAQDDSSLNLEGAFFVRPSVNWSWEYFNLSLGVGYGNIFVPGVHVVLPVQWVQPDVDFYWTF